MWTDGEGNEVKTRNGARGVSEVWQARQWQIVVVSGGAVPLMDVWPQVHLPVKIIVQSRHPRVEISTLEEAFRRLIAARGFLRDFGAALRFRRSR